MGASRTPAKSGARVNCPPIPKFWSIYSRAGSIRIYPQIRRPGPMPVRLGKNLKYFFNFKKNYSDRYILKATDTDKKGARTQPKPLPSNVPFALIEKSSSPPEYYIQSRVPLQNVTFKIFIKFLLINIIHLKNIFRNHCTTCHQAARTPWAPCCSCSTCWIARIMAWLAASPWVAPGWIFCPFLTELHFCCTHCLDEQLGNLKFLNYLKKKSRN